MYNSITEQKIRSIPSIGDTDTERLPQILTGIYAEVITLRRQVADGTITTDYIELQSSMDLLLRLTNNLETILLNNPSHPQKEAIAFVAATANSLIYKLRISQPVTKSLEIDAISPNLAAIILFLIGNSQADAAEAAQILAESSNEEVVQQLLIKSITALATGELEGVSNLAFSESEIDTYQEIQSVALSYLWREIGLGVIEMTRKLMGKLSNSEENHFDKVIDLSVSDQIFFDQRSILSGPYRLARLLKILAEDIYDRATINIPAPRFTDPSLWGSFLEKLASQRPYLWENHKEATNSSFLEHGNSAILTFPTGAGKSTLSELKLASCLYAGKRAIYLVPTHALEDQVSRNLKSLFDDFNPINLAFDSEYSELGLDDDFPFQVMTPERCLTLINISPEYFSNLGLIVFDEFHLISGRDLKKDRRAIDAMYCLLSLFTMHPGADYLLISAMVENGEEMSSWVAEVTKRRCFLFDSNWKPTRQLHGCLVFDEDEINALEKKIEIAKTTATTSNPPARLKRETKINAQCFFSLKNIWDTTDDQDYFRAAILDDQVTLGINNYWNLTTNRNEIAADLAIHFSKMGLKTLVFVDNPRIANSTASRISQHLPDFTGGSEELDTYATNYAKSLEVELGSLTHSYFGVYQNVSMHHGLLLPVERTLIEADFKKPYGSIVLVATATLAQGINLPAEIVIIAGDDRYDEDDETRQTVKPHELLNAAGRAGRAGLSSQGAVILIPGELVSIKENIISSRWWDLRNKVFSKGDQCLSVEDPLEYFLDSLQEDATPLTSEQLNILHRFKPEKIADNETVKLFNNSLSAYKYKLDKKEEEFSQQVRKLLDRRNELDASEEPSWLKDIAYKTGLEPFIINALSEAISIEDTKAFLSKSIPEYIDYFFEWLKSDSGYLEKVFTKPSTIDQIKKVVGLRPEANIEDVVSKLSEVAKILKKYVNGVPLNHLNDIIPNIGQSQTNQFLPKARNFVLRLLPELSFGLGLLSLIIVTKAKQQQRRSIKIPWDIRILASCIREGFDSADKLFFKRNIGFLMRVETHLAYRES